MELLRRIFQFLFPNTFAASAKFWPTFHKLSEPYVIIAMIDCVTFIESENKEEGKEPCPRFQDLSKAGNRYWLSSFKVSKFKITSFRTHSKYFSFSDWPLTLSSKFIFKYFLTMQL